MEVRTKMAQAKPESLLENLRAEHVNIQGQTWQNEADLMALLEEALDAYWNCLLCLEGYSPRDDVEQGLVYLSAAAFQSLQSVFKLLELGYYRHAAAGVRTLVNECLLCLRFLEDSDSAARFMSAPDWVALRKLASRLCDELAPSSDWERHVAKELSAAIDQRVSFRAYVLAGELKQSKQVPERLKEQKLKPMRRELGKQRVAPIGELLDTLPGGAIAPEAILDYRCDVEWLHRNVHSAPDAILREVVGLDEIGGLSAIPRYERVGCRYCGYRALVWSGTQLALLTGYFERLNCDTDWKLRLQSFENRVVAWGEQTQLDEAQVDAPN